MISFYLSIIQTEDAKDKVIFIYEHFYSFMCYTAGEVLGHNKNDVEDAVHNAMLKIIENIDFIDITNISKVKNLCGIIAKNKAKDHCKLKVNQTVDLDGSSVSESNFVPSPDEIVIGETTAALILEAIRDHDDTYRDVCLLRFVHEYKIREIASLLDLPEGTVSIRLSRAKVILKESLRKENLYVR